jgi:hypothetical protein
MNGNDVEPIAFEIGYGVPNMKAGQSAQSRRSRECGLSSNDWFPKAVFA